MNGLCDVAQLIIRDVQKLGQLRPVRRRLVQHNQELTVRQHGPGRMGLEQIIQARLEGRTAVSAEGLF